MKDFKLKMILSVLGGIIFSFIFIIGALVVPVKKEKKHTAIRQPKGKLEIISHTLKKR